MHLQGTKCANFQAKYTNLTFLAQIWPKIDFSSKLKKTNVESESASPRYHVCQLLDKTNNFDFFGPNCPKRNLKSKIHNTKIGIRTSILKISCVPIFS